MKISNFMNVPQILLSSENNGNISLFVKSSLVYVITFVLLKNGYTPEQVDIVGIVNSLINIFAILGAIFGLMRKITNRIEK